MSAIAGVFSRRGAPRRPGEIDEMLTVMASRGPDGRHIWTGDRITLGHGALHATPESVGEQMPLVDSLTGNVIVADVRLDNRPELLHELGLDGRDASKIGDGRLLLDAYRTWGEDCVDHLLGDFAFAIWDERRQQLFLARDHFGAKPLTYHSNDDFFAFASDSRSVVGLEGVANTINRDRVFDFFTGWTEWADFTSTMFSSVHRLQSAHVITVSHSDQRLRRYWHLAEPEMLRLNTDAEYVEATREVLDAAIACRLRGRDDVGVVLSGGIDSSAIAATAVEHGRVRTYSGVSTDPGCIETSLIRATTAALPVDARTVLDSSSGQILGDFASVQRRLESPFDSGALIRSVFSVAASDGCRSVLTGVLADEVIAISPAFAMQAFLSDGQPREILRLVAADGNLRSMTGRRRLTRAAVAAVLGTNPRFSEYLEKRRSDEWEAQKRSEIGRAHLRASDDELLRLDQRFDSTRWIWRTGDGPGSNRYRLFDSGYGSTALERYDRAAADQSVECRNPFMDRRVVEFFQRLPAHQLVSGGWTKSVLRRSMEGRLPSRVVWSRSKRHLGWSFNADWNTLDAPEYLRGLSTDHPGHEYIDIVEVLADPSRNSKKDLDWDVPPNVLRFGLWLEGHTA